MCGRWLFHDRLDLCHRTTFLTQNSCYPLAVSLRAQLAVRLAKSDTISAVRTIQTILDSVDDHGVVDVFNNYPIQELIAAIYALSRLQAASEFHNDTVYGETGTFHPMKDFPLLEDDELLEELCHYASFASAAYGWWLDLATAGRFHRGDLHAVLRMTKIDPEDVVKVDWESRANRPVRVTRIVQDSSYHHITSSTSRI